MMSPVTGSVARFRTGMKSTTVIVVAASSDIGAHLVRHYLDRGAEVIGTYRNHTPLVPELEKAGARLYPLDIDAKDDVASFVERLRVSGVRWDALISAPGLLTPIGPFFQLDFDAWERSVMTNSTSQLRVLHALYGLRSQPAKVIFFAGGGTNSAFDNYSAYCIGKLSLIKMTELLDSECPDLQVSIIGTGWVNTKIHRQTLEAGLAAGDNYEKTRGFIQNDAQSGASLETVAECVDWCLAAPRAAVGGRNFSLVHDAWTDPQFVSRLEGAPGTYKLRRQT